MESLFLLLLLLTMGVALTSGFPVAFSLPGSAILTIGTAALAGYVFAGDPSAYFAQDGPIQWLSSGVTNFRSVYWEVERDTLIAIPLFVFMGIMLQRSRIAEDLLVAMAQLFGPVPGGLGISVVFVGALLAATTGIVGATVIAMGMISLPAMLRHNYSQTLATGTICASGTLGQIIPPSIVLIILADQLSNAADVANNLRREEYRLATGQSVMPGEFEVVSASAGDMFVGAIVPGLILVGIYMLYILGSALLRPGSAPPIPYDGQYDRQFARRVLLALLPPLALIFVVLGSILLGVATVNQAGAVGAIGAMVMGSYRLAPADAHRYTPALLTLGSVIVLGVLLQFIPVNVRNLQTDTEIVGLLIALGASAVLLVGVGWSILRAYQIEDTLQGVMLETAKTSSMVFIILLGAAMLTAAFRGFGGEHFVKETLTSLPGGFWTQFFVVMFVIFLLGFFLDFIEIAVVVVPLVAPILLANPEANVTAVWLGVMLGLNLQTSFLTPPFGFALFYLRGVAPPEVKTTNIYKGVTFFIGLQLLGLLIAGSTPPLVNYLPNRSYLGSDNAPPPINPQIQRCLEAELFPVYENNFTPLEQAVANLQRVDVSALPAAEQRKLQTSMESVLAVPAAVAAIRQAERDLDAFSQDYAPLRAQVRDIQSEMYDLDAEIAAREQQIQGLRFREVSNKAALKRRYTNEIADFREQRAALAATIPTEWTENRDRFRELAEAERKGRLQYRRVVDEAYKPIPDLMNLLATAARLQALRPEIEALQAVAQEAPDADAKAQIEAVEERLNTIEGAYPIQSRLKRAARVFRRDDADRAQAAQFIAQSLERLDEEVRWREAGRAALLPALQAYEAALRPTIGVRLQTKLPAEFVGPISACRSGHRDLSLFF
jgi:tripartite ATP-independent transporter DctM subunit